MRPAKKGDEMKQHMSLGELADAINAGLVARGIHYATAAAWNKGEHSRIYVNVGRKADGFIEVLPSELRTVGCSRLQLTDAVAEILGLQYVVGGRYYSAPFAGRIDA